MLLNYAVIDKGCYYDYLYAAPHSKTMRGNGITLFLLHISQCIVVNQTKSVTATLISKTWLKKLYSRLGFKVIKDFETSPIFEESCKRFHYESGK